MQRSRAMVVEVAIHSIMGARGGCRWCNNKSKMHKWRKWTALVEVMANSMERGLLEWGAEIISIIEMGWVNRKHAVMVRELCASRWCFELVREAWRVLWLYIKVGMYKLGIYWEWTGIGLSFWQNPAFVPQNPVFVPHKPDICLTWYL